LSATPAKPLFALRQAPPAAPGRCADGYETVACLEHGRWLCRENATADWRRSEHLAIDAVMERRKAG
jgi:hypothetical protein